MPDIMKNTQLPAPQTPQARTNPITLEGVQDTEKLSQEIIARANAVEAARMDLANINLVGARAIDNMDANFTELLKTKKTEIDSQFETLNDVLVNRTKQVGLPSFVTNLLGFFDDDYNVHKQEIRAQGAQTTLQRIQQDISTADAIRKTNMSRVGTVLDAAKTNFSVAATSSQTLRESAATIFAAKDQAFQQQLRGVQSASDDILQSAVNTPNANMPAGLAQAELVRRAEQRERLKQMQLDTTSKGIDVKNKVQQDFFNNLTVPEIEHLMKLSKEDKVAGGVMLADGKTFVSDAKLKEFHTSQKKKEEEFTQRQVNRAQVPVRLKMAEAQLTTLSKLPGAVDQKLLADIGALQAKVAAATGVGNDTEMVSAADQITKMIAERQKSYIAALPKAKRAVYQNYVDNGGFVNDSIAATELMGDLFVNRDALAGTLLSPVYQNFADLMHEIDQDNYRFVLPTKGQEGGMDLNIRKAGRDAAVSKALRTPNAKGVSFTDDIGGYVYKDATLFALETLAKQDILKAGVPGGPSSSPFKDILEQQKYYKLEGTELVFSGQALVHELEAKTNELRRAGVLDGGTSLTDIFRRTLSNPDFMQAYDNKYFGSLSPEAQAFNTLIVPGGRPSVLLGKYASKEIPTQQLAIKKLLAEQQAQAQKQIDALKAMQDQEMRNGGGTGPALFTTAGKSSKGKIGTTVAPEQAAAAIETLKQENSPQAVTDRIRTMLGVFSP